MLHFVHYGIGIKFYNLCIKSFKYTHIIGKTKILEYIIDMLMLLLEISKWKS